MTNLDFYDNLDLKYIEIGTAMTIIDRVKPGKIPFTIPVLTPDLDTSTMKDSNITQRSKSNIVNENSGSVEVSDIATSNYIYIEIPRELCAQPDCEYYVEGTLHLQGKFDSYSSLHGSGTVVEGGHISVSGSLGAFKANNTKVLSDSKLMCTPTKDYRYIDKYSKWAICFLGGDINMPRVICRLPD
jgi:hypothetical protein